MMGHSCACGVVPVVDKRPVARWNRTTGLRPNPVNEARPVMNLYQKIENAPLSDIYASVVERPTIPVRSDIPDNDNDTLPTLPAPVAISAEDAVAQGSRLVYHIARRMRGPGAELEDLAQEGFVALLEAAQRYRRDLGVSFSSFAYRAIHGAVLRASLVARRRGMTPSHDYQEGVEREAPLSMDMVIDEEGASLHDLVGWCGAPEEMVDLLREPEVTPPKRGRTMTYKGRTQTMWAWAKELGCAFIVLYNRVVVKSWTDARAIETPVGKRQGGRGCGLVEVSTLVLF